MVGKLSHIDRLLCDERFTQYYRISGYHPWFAHWIAIEPATSKEEHYRSLFLGGSPKPESIDALDKLLTCLPEPISLQSVLSEVRQNLIDFPNAMLGEVGIDRAARIPFMPPSPPPYVEDDGKRELSPFTIPQSHQMAIFEAQLELAVDLKRNVSVHSVKSQQATGELLARMKTKHGSAWNAISIDLHSCGFSAQSWLEIEVRNNDLTLPLLIETNMTSSYRRSMLMSIYPSPR